MVISKSEFMMFLKHPAWLWLKKYDKDKLPAPDAELQALFDEGTLFESYAEKLFPKAVKLGYKNDGEFSGTKYYGLPELTKSELEKKTKVLMQGRLEIENITSIFDVLERVGENVFDLYEIKSSTSVKPEEISKKTEVTEDVRSAIPETLDNIEKAFKVLESKTAPDLSPRYLAKGADNMAEWLQILQVIKGDFPHYSIYKLMGPDPKTIAWLEDNGIELLNDIPLDGPLTKTQLRQIEAIKSGTQHIDKEEISNFLNELKYPLYFLDYETLAGVIPTFDGYRPYQQVPFQYSLHILSEPGGELIHKEYLHTKNSDPVPALLEHLHKDIGGSGSVISWYMTFEKSRNTEMSQMHPKYEKFLSGLNDRMSDLMVPFSKGWFVDKDFFGRASIKWVLPALLPELSYKELNITNGGQAQRIWMETILKGKNAQQKEQILEDLRKYCNLDTYAMYAIYKYLLEAI